ncbi:5935_t:CDS:2 [Funneliformis mosseae]|uniref:5935_t:CDS:1 n=1 Tax=Funneliformis mosseae TaxID=27381 RepID=A0A9N8WD01_FUNMO|nr:5935_t:CDS:2 [Funneliformis mosseae]
MPATIQIPKDVFVRLKPATDGTSIQGILFGQREECLNHGLVIHVKGFYPYKASSQELDSTIAKLMNWKGQTVLGWFAAPGSDVTSRFETARIASAYFRAIQASMLKVIVYNFLGQHTESEGEEIVQMIVREACALFQDLIGFVVQRLPKTPNTLTTNTIMDTDSTTSQAFFSAPTFNEVLSQFQNLNQETKSDIMEMNIMQGLMEGVQAVNGSGHNGASVNNHVKVMDDREDEDDDLGELFSLWGNGQGPASKKLRTRRASTTDIADGPLRKSLYGNISEFLDDIPKKRKGFDIDNNNKNAIKKAKPPTSNITNVIPAPFKVIPGQASEYFQQAHGDDSIHYSSDFDESLMTSYTASFFAPINLGQPSSLITTFAQARITSAYDAISHHINSHTREKISRYEKSCHEYELLLEILEALDGVVIDTNAVSETRSEEVDIESSDSEPQDSNSDNDRENENPADTSPKTKKTTIKCCVDNENKSEDGEMDDETSLSNNNGVVNGEVSSSSSMEEGEIDEEEEPGIAWQTKNDCENNKKSDNPSSSPFHNKNISLNLLEVGKKTTNTRDDSPGWAWDDEEIED